MLKQQIRKIKQTKKIKKISWYVLFIKNLKRLDNLFYFVFHKIDKSNKTQKATIKTTKKVRKITLPLYFGWMLTIMISRAEDWQKHVIKPFKAYWQYIAVIVLFITLTSASLFIYNSSISKAATYNFVQTDWSSGITINNATHSSNRTGWSEYISKDTNISAGTEIVLNTTSTSTIQTSDLDFNAGTTSTTTISGSGSSASVTLEPAASGSNDYIDVSSSLAWKVVVNGNYAYVAQYSDGFKIYNISNPSSLSLEGELATTAAYDVDIYGNYAYVADYTGNLKIIDISNKTSLSLVNTIDVFGNEISVDIQGDILYVLGGQSGCSGYCFNNEIVSYDLSVSPTNPTLLSSISSSDEDQIKDIDANGNWLYFATAGTTDRFKWIDISNPSNMLWNTTDYVNLNSNFTDNNAVISYGSTVYLSMGDYGIVSISTSTKSILQNWDEVAGSAKDLDIEGSTLYVSYGSGGMSTINISNPSSMSLRNTYSITGTSAYGIDYNNSDSYVYISDSTGGIESILISTYNTAGTFISSIIDIGGNTEYNTISWNKNLPSGTTLTMKVRSDSNSDMSGATVWASCNTVTSGTDISSNNCVTDGDRYIQYQAILGTSDSVVSPQLNDLSIQYNSYSNGSLLSSPYNTENSANVMGTISWTESGTGDVQLQVRTAPDSGESPDWVNGSGWCGPSNCAATTGDTDYAASYYTTSGASLYSTQQDGSSDQWYQYRLWLTSANGATTPTFSDITVSYVVNVPPDFESTVTASQGSDGLITIDYSVRDIDTTSGATSGKVIPSFQYSLDNGSNWHNITTGLSTNATSTNTAVNTDEVSYTAHQVTWTPKNQIDQYSTQTKIKVIVDDSEAANNTASSISVAFTMDAKAPVAGSPAIVVVATTTPASLTLSASDDTALNMCITLDNTETNCNTYNSTSTLSLPDAPDTAYVIFKDAYSNTTSANVVTPDQPNNMIIRDLSNVLVKSVYRLFVSWAAVSEPGAGFNRYEIWHSTDGSTYTWEANITTKATNYYLDDSLIADSTHYYKVYTVDNNGNTSKFSSVVSDTADGQGGTDASPPTISSVATSTISTQTITFTWDTDELSNSTVGYSTSTGNYATTVGVATMVTSTHSVILTGLTPGTTYYSQVQSADPDNNESTDNNGGNDYIFSTLAGPAISNTGASTVQNTNATITWTTDVASDSRVYYSTNSDMSGYTATPIDITSVTEHSVTIPDNEAPDLVVGTRYYFYVKSGVAIDNNGGDYYYLNTTSDSTGPVITNVTENLVTDDDAVIIWDTDEEATSRVAYGLLTGVYTTYTTTTSVYNTSHSMTITPLANNTSYYYRVTSADSAGNTSTSTESSFTTLEKLSEESDVVAREEAASSEGAATVSCGGGGGSSRDRTAPKLSNIVVSSSDLGTDITWDTNENSIAIVNYGIEKVDELSVTDPNSLVTKTRIHAISLTGLIPNTIYKYKAVAIDGGGNVGYSEEGTFTSGEFLLDIGNATSTDKMLNKNVDNTVNQITDYFQKLYSEVSITAAKDGVLTLVNEMQDIIPPPIISGEPSLTIGSNSISISWTTDDEANALVSYVSEDYYLSNNDYEYTIGNPDLYLAGLHQVDITGLEPETIYHYKIISKNEVGSTSQSKDFTFTTLAELAAIENYTTEIVSPEEVVFKWITTVPTDSNVKYTPYRNGNLNLDDSRLEANDIFTTIHNITASDLEAGVLYQVELYGDTISGNTINQIIPSFATSDDNLAPIIRQVKTDAALSFGKETKVQAIISWYTNEPSTSRVFYEKGAGRADEELTLASPMDENFARHHVVVITNFNPGSIYRFQVESTDSEGNASRSRTYTILTPKQHESVFQVIMKNVEISFGWLQVFK